MAVLGELAAMVIIVALRGFALQVLWGWFVVEWFGLKALSIPEALGLALIVGFVTHQHQYQEGGERWSFTQQLVYAIIAPLMVLRLDGCTISSCKTSTEV